MAETLREFNIGTCQVAVHDFSPTGEEGCYSPNDSNFYVALNPIRGGTVHNMESLAGEIRRGLKNLGYVAGEIEKEGEEHTPNLHFSLDPAAHEKSSKTFESVLEDVVTIMSQLPPHYRERYGRGRGGRGGRE